MFKKIILFCFITSVALAECDFSTGIIEKDGSFVYTRECHLKVGKMEKDLTLTYQLIDKQDQRIILWRDTAYALEEKVNSVDRWKETNKTLYFILGVIVTSASVWGAGQLK